MKRLRFLSLAALVAFAACDEGTTDITPPPVEGSITGTVMIEGQAASGITVSLSSGSSTTTDGSGSFAFSNVPAGAYTVTISGFASDVTFSSTSKGAVISSAGQTVTVSFDGSYVRTASVSGSVSAGGAGIAGVTVTLSGPEGASTATNSAGTYAFTGLRAGSYTVEISGFDADEYSFATTSASVSVSAGQAATASFEGTLKATAKIIGSVLIEGEAQSGVTVTLSGDAEGSTTTGTAGTFEFSGLKKGTYTVTISGFSDEAEFGSTTSTATIASATSVASVEFSGTFKRTASVAGTVSAAGTNLANVVVSLSGVGDAKSTTTNSAGQYSFTGLRKGDYSITIAGFDATEYSFASTTQSVTLGVGETGFVAFEGTLLATASISGTVTVEGTALSGVTVTLAGDKDDTATTDADGKYTFTGLTSGTYTVTVSGLPTDVSLAAASASVSITSATDAKTADFGATYIRTSSIVGTVTAGGNNLAGVTVALSGLSTGSDTTDSNGQFAFTGLRAGDYTLTISGFSATEYSFSTTTASATVGVGASKTVNFGGALQATAKISGKVTVEGAALAGVTVTLGGAASDTKTSAADGSYEFTGLAAGDYTVSVSGQAADISFSTSSSTVVVSSATDAKTADFDGTYIRTSSVSGTVTAGGNPVATVTVTLSGPSTGTAVTDAAGAYSFTGLRAGDYTIAISNFSATEYTFATQSASKTLAVGGSATADFAGTLNATAKISGTVTVESAALANVVVSLSGTSTGTDTTDAAGAYEFSGLTVGSYTVKVVSGFASDISFTSSSAAVTVASAADAKTQAFDGAWVRTSSLTGIVTVDGAGLANAIVTAVGPETYADTTDSAGRYSFTNIRAGSYTITLSGFDATVNNIPTTSKSATLSVGGAETVDFTDGTVQKTAKISGVVFVDENPANGIYEGSSLEDNFTAGSVTVTLVGPTTADTTTVTTSTGAFSFDSLAGGSYIVSIPGAAIGNFTPLASKVSQTVVNLAVGGESSVNFPMNITTQTVKAGVFLGSEAGGTVGTLAVPNVQIDLYDTQTNASAGGATGKLNSSTVTTGADGMATFTFLRSNEKSPAGPTDNVVFARIVTQNAAGDLPAPLGDIRLEKTTEQIIEIPYAGKDASVMSPDTFDVLNAKVRVKFAGRETDGDSLKTWSAWVFVNDSTGATPPAFFGALDANGETTFTQTITPTSLPATFYFKIANTVVQAGANGHAWSQSPSAGAAGAAQGSFVTYTHTGLTLDTAVYMAGTQVTTYLDEDIQIRMHNEVDDTANYTTLDVLPAFGQLEARVWDPVGDTAITAFAPVNGSGEVTFSNVKTGSWQVIARPVRPANANVDVLNDSIQAITLAGANQADTVKALTGSKGYSSFAFKYNDASIGGAVKDASATVNADGVMVKISTLSNFIQPNLPNGSDTTVMVSGGAYNVTGLREGPYMVQVMDSINTSTGDTMWAFLGVDSANVSPSGATAATTQNFIATRMDTQIQGAIINDRDGDGTLDGGDALQGAIVTLYEDQDADNVIDSGEPLVRTDTTDANGAYSFSKLKEATYIVQATSTDADVTVAFSAPGTHDNTQQVTTKATTVGIGANNTRRVGTTSPSAPLPAWNYATDATGGTTPLAHFTHLLKGIGTINGRVMDNATGLVGQSGVKVILTRCISLGTAPSPPASAAAPCTKATAIAATETTTDSNGNYSFSSLDEGVYVIEVVPQSVNLNNVFTNVVGGTVYHATIQKNVAATDVETAPDFTIS